MKRTLEDIRANLDHVGCDNATAAEMCAEIERLIAALVQVRGFAHVMDESNWRDLRLHIERQCDVLDDDLQQPQEKA
jgi:hypothetical protein